MSQGLTFQLAIYYCLELHILLSCNLSCWNNDDNLEGAFNDREIYKLKKV